MNGKPAPRRYQADAYVEPSQVMVNRSVAGRQKNKNCRLKSNMILEKSLKSRTNEPLCGEAPSIYLSNRTYHLVKTDPTRGVTSATADH